MAEADEDEEEENASRKNLSSCLFYLDRNWKTPGRNEKLKWSCCWSFLSDFRNERRGEARAQAHKSFP